MCDVCLAGKYSSGVSWDLIISYELDSLDFKNKGTIGININLTFILLVPFKALKSQ